MRRIHLVDGAGRRWLTDVATGRAERARGLLGRRSIAPTAALLLPGVTSVHTFGMRFTISAAWLSADGRVVAVRRLSPWRLALPRRGARYLLECAVGAAPRVGDRLSGLPERVSGPRPSWGRADGRDRGGSTRGTRGQHVRVT
jgi:uncharacterized protein